MTAIAGYWSLAGAGDAKQGCARILRSQRHYADEDGKIVGEGDIAIGRALFHLLPEDRHDRGPQVSSDGRFMLVADVRIDNRADLARKLDLGGELTRMSDSHLVLEAWRHWGVECLQHLVGDFAFAVWDAGQRQIFLARDFLGQRPLHYHLGEDFVAFASMPKGLHALPRIARSPDAQAMTHFLALLPENDSSSFFEGIDKVPAGHVVTIDISGRSTLSRYWRPDTTPIDLRPDEYADALRGALDQAVEARLRGADPVGTYLSAGLDSSSVTASAASLLTPKGGRVCAFTAVPDPEAALPPHPEAFSDEGPLAARVAALHANIEHVRVRHSHSSPVEAFDSQFHLYERPVLNPVNFVWINQIRSLAKARGIRVLLSGSAGNHTLSYAGMEWLTVLFASGRWWELARLTTRVRRSGYRSGTIAAQVLGPFLPRRLWRAIAAARHRGRALSDYSLVKLDDHRLAEISAEAESRRLDLSYRPRRDPVATRIWALQRVDPGNYNKGALAGWGIDERDPTADRRLVELCLRLPTHAFIRDGMPRSLVREAMKGRLPPELLRERRRGVQAADWPAMMEASRDLLIGELEALERTSGVKEIVDLDRMRRLVTQLPGKAGLAAQPLLYQSALMRASAAGHFLRKASGAN